MPLGLLILGARSVTMRTRSTTTILLLAALAHEGASAEAPSFRELPLPSATLMRTGDPADVVPVMDRFGPGLDSVDLPGARVFKTQLRFPCGDVPEGDYSLGLLTMMPLWSGSLGFGEHFPNQVQAYLNDTRLVWTSHTEPVRPENAAEWSLCQAEIRADAPIHVKPSDVLRLVCMPEGGAVTVGPLRLYREPPAGGLVKLNPPDWGRPTTLWLDAQWEATQRDGDTVRQPCVLYNPGVLPRTFTLLATGKDYLQRVLLASREELTLQPGEKLTKTFALKPGDSGWARLSVSAMADGVSPAVRLSKFYVDDIVAGSRPNTCLNGEWEMCFVPVYDDRTSVTVSDKTSVTLLQTGIRVEEDRSERSAVSRGVQDAEPQTDGVSNQRGAGVGERSGSGGWRESDNGLSLASASRRGGSCRVGGAVAVSALSPAGNGAGDGGAGAGLQRPVPRLGGEEDPRPPLAGGRALLAVVYGRRRIGKTALVEQTFRDDTLWKFEGIEAGDRRTQLSFFAKQLSHYVPPGEPLTLLRWEDAFEALGNAITQREKQHSGRLVLFFDEFQWFCEMKPAVVTVFKYYWDNFFSKHPQRVFVLCGSVSSFLVKKVLQSRALYGRVDLEIHLHPLSLRESQQLLRGAPYAAEALDTYLVFGGVPQYLVELNPTLSLQQNLNEYAFRASGFFFREFDRLFISHFAQHPTYEPVLRALSERRLIPAELTAKCQLLAGGTFSARMKELELAGFVRALSPVDKGPNSRLIRYSLDNEYLHFYFRFIAPHSAEIVSGNLSFPQINASRAFDQWRGYAFERLCRKHAKQLADHLRFGGISHRSGAWFQRGMTERAGGQVDLLFVRADSVLTVCEMKYTARLAPRQVVSELEGKVDLLRAAFPGHALERVLVLGKPTPKLDQLRPHFDHVLTADEVFLG